MKLQHKDLKTYFDKWFSANQTTRRRVATEMMFFHVTHWDSLRIDGTDLAYRGEFDKLKKSMNKIMATLKANPVQVDFEAIDESREDSEEIIDGLYRRDARRNTAIESFNNAKMECIVGGVGAWHIYTRYEKRKGNSKNQCLDREPIFEANNTLFWDDNAKLSDKSDAIGVGWLTAYSKDGIKKLAQELTSDKDYIPSSFSSPEQSYTYPWVGGENDIHYVVTMYHKDEVNDNIITLKNTDDNEVFYFESKIKYMLDELVADGYRVVDIKKTKRNEVTKYIATGDRILSENIISGENIPVVPIYANRAYVEGQEHYEGMTKTAKDPQILYDFQMSYIADIVSRTPINKPLLYQEQISGLEKFWNIGGADDHYGYRLLNRKALSDGADLPLATGSMPAPEIPQSLAISLGLVKQAIDDVLPADIPKDFAETDLSGKALLEMNRIMNEQSFLYQESYKHSLRRDAVICASIYSDIIDSPRDLKVTMPDGTSKTIQYMQAALDEETGEFIVRNDITNLEFDVFAEIGESYSSKQNEDYERLGEMAESMAPFNPDMSNSLMLQQLTMLGGSGLKNVRKNARMQLVMSGFQEPETDEEKALIEQQQNQPQQPDSGMAMAQAEMANAQARLEENKVTLQRDQLKAQNDSLQTQIDEFNAETSRYEVMVNAKEADANIDFKNNELVVKQNENILRFRASVNQR